MYEAHWNLQRRPFEATIEDAFYYPSESHQGALLKLRYALENHRAAALLAGPSGVGKTMLVQTLRRQLPEDFSPFVHLVFPRMSGAEIVNYVADELGAPPAEASGRSVDQAVRRIERRLAENTRQQRHAIVVVDEAHLLADTEALETLRLLLNFELAARPGLSLLLVGQPSLLPSLSRMPDLDERLGVKSLMRPFTMDESICYVNHRLNAAGARQVIFDATALEAVHHLTHGVARAINRLCDLALLVGYAEGLDSLTDQQIESVCDELVTVAPE